MLHTKRWFGYSAFCLLLIKKHGASRANAISIVYTRLYKNVLCFFVQTFFIVLHMKHCMFVQQNEKEKKHIEMQGKYSDIGNWMLFIYMCMYKRELG